MPAKGAEKYKLEDVRAALENNKTKTGAAKELGCSLTTVKKYCKKHSDLEQIFKDMRYTIADMAEIGLIKLIKAGHPGSIHYALSTQGKGRGYTKTIEHTGEGGGAIEHDIKPNHALRSVLDSLMSNEED